MNFLLKREKVSISQKLSNISLGFTFMVFWTFLIGVLFNFLLPVSQFEGTAYTFFSACIMAPLWEELLFRYGPITIARKLGKEYMLPIIVMSSILFGMGHGMTQYHILIQGVMGFILSLVYIKNGYSYKSSVLLHFLWNLFVIFVAPTFAG